MLNTLTLTKWICLISTTIRYHLNIIITVTVSKILFNIYLTNSHHASTLPHNSFINQVWNGFIVLFTYFLFLEFMIDVKNNLIYLNCFLGTTSRNTAMLWKLDFECSPEHMNYCKLWTLMLVVYEEWNQFQITLLTYVICNLVLRFKLCLRNIIRILIFKE